MAVVAGGGQGAEVLQASVSPRINSREVDRRRRFSSVQGSTPPPPKGGTVKPQMPLVSQPVAQGAQREALENHQSPCGRFDDAQRNVPSKVRPGRELGI